MLNNKLVFILHQPVHRFRALDKAMSIAVFKAVRRFEKSKKKQKNMQRSDDELIKMPGLEQYRLEETTIICKNMFHFFNSCAAAGEELIYIL